MPPSPETLMNDWYQAFFEHMQTHLSDKNRQQLRFEFLPGRQTLLLHFENGQPRKWLSRLLKVPGFSDHLCEWPGHLGNLAVCANSPDQVPLALVVKGSLMITTTPVVQMSEPKDSPARGGSGRKPTFDRWFESLIEQPFPIPGVSERMLKLQKDVWSDRPPQSAAIKGFPKRLALATPQPYRLIGYGGYGINSYALYETLQGERGLMTLRLSYGGVYGDPDKKAADAISALKIFEDVYRTLDASGLAFYIVSNMGHHRILVSRNAEALKARKYLWEWEDLGPLDGRSLLTKVDEFCRVSASTGQPTPLEPLLINQVYGCIHREVCTTGCQTSEADLLLSSGYPLDEIEAVLKRWERDGMPPIPPSDNPFVDRWRGDVGYKLQVLRIARERAARSAIAQGTPR